MEGQRVKARAGSTFKETEKNACPVDASELEAVLETTGDNFEGYEGPASGCARVWRVYGSGGATESSTGREGLRGARHHAFTSSRRPGCRITGKEDRRR